jgi:hypothetical protein
MADYQLTATDAFVIRTSDDAIIPNDPNNRDWVAYQDWLAAGGVPDPYLEPAPTPPEPGTDALFEANRANARLDDGVNAAQGSMTTLANMPEITVSPGDPVTQEQFAALQAQVDALEETTRAMLQAHAETGATPARSAPVKTP